MTVTKKKIGYAIVLGASLCVTGCRTEPAEGRIDPIHEQDYPQITALDELEEQLVFGTPSVYSPADRPMSVVVPMRAAIGANDDDMAVQYRFEFLDSLGRPIEPSMGWRHILLPPRVTRFVEGAALDTDAVDWRLELRLDKKP